ncbi:MAG TPA: CoA ester lyase [Sphingomonas sp.]|uniref:HpcH/HpaI aldolase/citrate lyase family protein n=1 Tax=Sphingomonas sp. TaxID=28214 RepID=UPI002BC50E2E|nr:CoA ester lyase [Sphingomonas sp.]HMI20971.1 CoA ester lyase [Sphingomonas sp.]
MRLRSLLFVPGDRPDRMEKALGFGADALILDLEDSVAEAKKVEAREAVVDFLGRADRSVPLLVRVNPLGSAHIDADLVAVTAARADAIMLPKAEGAKSILALSTWTGLPILPIATETPAAVFALGSYAEVGDRLLGLTWGAEDLPAAIGATAARETDGRYTAPIETVRSLALFAAHAAGVAAIETVYPDFSDLDGLAAYAARGARDGFTGMMAIHPDQIAVINQAFTPSDGDVAAARAIVDAFAANPHAGVLAVDGKMVDAPHLAQAKRVLERAGQGA